MDHLKPHPYRIKAVRQLFMAILWSVLIGLRVAHLDSDAYARLSWSSALLTDEGFYLHNARNLLLFGHLRTDDFNNALIMPLLHLVQVAVFSLLGVGAVQARLISVGSSLLTLLVFFAALRRAFGTRTAWIALLLLGLDPVFVLYNRLALMDTPACLPLICAFYAWIRATAIGGKNGELESGGRDNPLFLFSFLLLCGLCLGLAYLVRGLTAIVMPVPFFLILFTASTTRKEGHKHTADSTQSTLEAARTAGANETANKNVSNCFVPLIAFCVGVGLVLLPYFLLWYLPHYQEIARVNAYYVRDQLLPQSGRGLILNISRGLFNGQRGMAPYLLKHSPVLLLLVVSRVVRMLLLLRQQCAQWKPSVSEQYLWGWLLFVAALTLSINYAPSRYYVLLFPPLTAISALEGNNLLDRLEIGKSCVRPPITYTLRTYTFMTLLCLISLCWSVGNFYWYSDWLRHLSYRQRDADHWLATHLPPDSVLIGAVSPGLCLNNRFRCINVIEGLCNDVTPVEKAAPAPRYILILDRILAEETSADLYPQTSRFPGRTFGKRPSVSPADRWKERYWLQNYPDLVRSERQIKAFPNMLRSFFTIGVYPVPAGYSGRHH